MSTIRLRRVAALATGAVVAGTASLAVTTPAHASADSWSVPARATVTIKGRGFGHGHGMSQYGAEGAARQGLDYRQIANFYYSGTDWGRVKGKVRVLISADTTDDLVVVARRGLALRDRSKDGLVALPDNDASRWRLRPLADGGAAVAFLKKGRWHRFTTISGEGQFTAHGDPIGLVTPSGTKTYRGRLRAAVPSAGSTARDTVNVLTLENYLRGVVPLEMPALWSKAAVRAQAVAARTYAAYERRHPHGSTYQICDTSSCQVYGGVGAEHPASDAAITATAHQVLEVGGEPAFTQFGASSGGWTAAGSVSYLTARKDPYDGWSGNGYHAWTVKVPDTTVERTWPSIGNLRRISVSRRDGHGAWGGRPGSVTLVGAQGRVSVSGDGFRSALGLRSTWVTFDVARRSGRVLPEQDQEPIASPDALAADLEAR